MKEKTTEEGNFKIIITQRLPERNKHLKYWKQNFE